MLLGFILSLVLGYIPFTWSYKDPFDELTSYLFWFVGPCLLAAIVAFRESVRTWKTAIAVGLGFPAAVIVNMILKPDSFQLPPITIVFSFIVGLVSSSIGSVSGRLLRNQKENRES